MDILKKYVCDMPFRHVEISERDQVLCCKSWLPVNINGTNLLVDGKSKLLDGWKSDVATDVRKSVMDGSYRYCNKELCPFLNELINTGIPGRRFMPIEEAEALYGNAESLGESFSGLPERINFVFDRSCNLKCPSCRADFIVNDDELSPSYLHKLSILNSIEKDYASTAKRLVISASAEPFYSKIFRDYLINFDKSKYPNLEGIKLFTNGNLLTEKMWNSLAAREYVDMIEISVDAGTKETYENITRLNGDWDKLIGNIKFISTIKTVKYKIFNMTVTELNYKEMNQLADIISDIFQDDPEGAGIFYKQIFHWEGGSYSTKEVDAMSVFNSEHKNFNHFVSELKTLMSKNTDSIQINHNFHHLLN